MLRTPSDTLGRAGFHGFGPRAEALFLSERTATVVAVMDQGGATVSVGEVLNLFGGTVVLVPESTLDALSGSAHEAFVEAAEETTGAIVFVVPDAFFATDVESG